MVPDERAEAVPAETTEVVGREELASDLPEVFEREDAPLPAIYEQAKRAVQTCEKVVKAKEFENQARALEQLGRMADDHEIIRAARSLRLYATRRAGEILRDFKRDPEENLPQHRDKGGRPSGDARPTTQREAAEDAGLSKHQERQARRVAEVPVEEFVRAAESDDPPTVTAMAERGMKSRGDAPPEPGDEGRAPEPTSRESAAETLREALDRFAWWCRVQDSAELRDEFEEEELAEAAEKVEEIVPWLRCFCAPDPEAGPLRPEPRELGANGGPPDDAEDDDEIPSEPEDLEDAAAEMDRVFDALDERTRADPSEGTDEDEAEEQEGCLNCSAPTRSGERLCAHCSAHGLDEEEGDDE